MRKNDGDGVEPVAEIVRDDAEGDKQSDLDTGLKANADRDAVEEAVKGQARCGHRAQLSLMGFRQVWMLAGAMHGGVALECEESEEAECRDGHVGCAVVEGEDFRQNVEQSYRQHGARAEAEQEMKPVAQADGGGPAQSGRNQSN